MYTTNLRGGSILHSNVNLFAGLLLIGVFSLGAVLVILHFAFQQDPIATMLMRTALVNP